MPKPDLFIVGAMKSGTTSLHHYLAAHPRVFMCEPKEPNFFVEELNWKRGMDWYLALFERGKNAAVIGESSTEYSKLPTYQGVARRIREFNPDARVIYLMRDPVDRIVSQYWHNVQDLRDEAERRDMLTAVREDPRYVAYSDYAMQLEPYLDLFGRDQVALLTFEELAERPAATVTSLCTWLGLENTVPESALEARWNARPVEARAVRGRGMLNRLRHSALWQAVRPLVPKSLRDGALELAERRIPVGTEGEAATAAWLRPILADRVATLTRLLGREFPEWTSLQAGSA